MNKIEFIYNSFSAAPYCVPQTNKITVWVEDGRVHYRRQYISESGKVAKPIGRDFEEGVTVEEVARMIHWGCSGTSKNSVQLHDLIEKIRPVMTEEKV